MARKQKPRSFFEPWAATKSTAWDVPFKGGCPSFVGVDEDRRVELIADWEAKKFRAERDAEWLIWGSRMAEPALVHNLASGTTGVSGSIGIIAISKKAHPEGTPEHDEVAKRIVACVNACAGIVDPETFVSDLRSLLLSYVRGEAEDPRDDPRVVGLLAKCIPLDELEKFTNESGDTAED